jgi:hypothetical protein
MGSVNNVSKAEIGHEHSQIRKQKHIGWLEMRVQGTLCMGIVKRLGGLGQQNKYFLRGEMWSVEELI